MKLNWGTGIAAVLIAFVVMMGWFAMRALNNPSPLVAEDYYKEELAYQADIDKLSNALRSGEEVIVTEGAGSLSLQFPASRSGATITGTLRLMRPSTELGDLTVDVSADSAGLFALATQDLIKGVYRMRLDWKMDGEERLTEKRILVR